MKDMAIVVTPQELVEKLAKDIEEVLNLRGKIHYAPRPDEMYDDDDVPDGAWQRWAERVYNNNNNMGHFLADAEKIVEALRRYVAEVEGSDDGND